MITKYNVSFIDVAVNLLDDHMNVLFSVRHLIFEKHLLYFSVLPKGVGVAGIRLWNIKLYEAATCESRRTPDAVYCACDIRLRCAQNIINLTSKSLLT